MYIYLTIKNNTKNAFIRLFLPKYVHSLSSSYNFSPTEPRRLVLALSALLVNSNINARASASVVVSTAHTFSTTDPQWWNGGVTGAER